MSTITSAIDDEILVLNFPHAVALLLLELTIQPRKSFDLVGLYVLILMLHLVQCYRHFLLTKTHSSRLQGHSSVIKV